MARLDSVSAGTEEPRAMSSERLVYEKSGWDGFTFDVLDNLLKQHIRTSLPDEVAGSLPDAAYRRGTTQSGSFVRHLSRYREAPTSSRSAPVSTRTGRRARRYPTPHSFTRYWGEEGSSSSLFRRYPT